MRSVYPVIFTQTYDEKETVLIEVPDLNIMTEGYGMADAIKMARDAIGLMGITLEDEKKPIPNPTNVSNIDITKATFKDDGESCISLVDIDFKEYRRAVDNKSVRRNVTLPSWLNKEAEQAQINVSKVLKEALMEVLGVSRT
ncbi:MAG: type II toxin-antitoxin system HicB family antitoxin [Lachnospiraceae bacterium]|nr:type II toxin-antitoxin system HicB family antitoxin [Lachnospiraceae bacterium]